MAAVGRKLFLHKGYMIVLYFLLYLEQGNPGLAFVLLSVYYPLPGEQSLSLCSNGANSETQEIIGNESINSFVSIFCWMLAFYPPFGKESFTAIHLATEEILTLN